MQVSSEFAQESGDKMPAVCAEELLTIPSRSGFVFQKKSRAQKYMEFYAWKVTEDCGRRFPSGITRS